MRFSAFLCRNYIRKKPICKDIFFVIKIFFRTVVALGIFPSITRVENNVEFPPITARLGFQSDFAAAVLFLPVDPERYGAFQIFKIVCVKAHSFTRRVGKLGDGSAVDILKLYNYIQRIFARIV